jgi:hypothetical protein
MSKVEDFLSDVRENYKESVAGWEAIYREASDDLRFVYDVDGGQWPDRIRADREKDGRPILTINKVQKFVRQCRGDQMQNRPRIKVIPVDSKADPPKAELYDGLIRQIEYLSNAGIAYDTAYNHSISSSVGFFRLITKYDNDDNFEQSIYIKRIVSPLSVHFDPFAQEFNLEDAKYCFIEDIMDKKRFKKLYPDAEALDFSSSSAAVFGDWLKTDKVRLAEYFWKDTAPKKLYLLEDGTTVEEKNKMTLEALKAGGHKIKTERTVDVPVVKWCKTNGIEKLEETTWPGIYIPVIPVFGDEVVVDGKKYIISMARGAKDPQRMYNYWATAGTETVALAPKNPYVVEKDQIDGFEDEWEEANRVNRMYIRYNAVAGLQKPSKEPQTQVPQAIMGMMQQTAYDVEDTLGKYEASQGKESNERSGKAIIARVQQSDKGTYTFVDNMTRAIVYAGKQIIDLIPKIYDTKRALRVMGDDGEEKLVNVNNPIGVNPDGSVVKENDLTVGKYDVIASVGASHSSKRQEMVEMLISSMQYAPAMAPAIAPLIFENSDWPGAKEVAAKLKEQAEMIQQQQAAAGKPPA